MRSWELTEGSPHLSGATWDTETATCNFTLYSKEAERVTLLIYGPEDFVHPVYTFDLDPSVNKSHYLWHCRVPAEKLSCGKYYAYRVDGAWNPAAGCRFDKNKILVDPFAQGIFFPPDFSRVAASLPGKNDGKAPLGLLPPRTDDFDWGEDRRPRHGAEAVIYEMHVGAFTKRDNSGVKEKNRGTFSGVIEKIPYLKRLGVNVVELMPVFQNDPQDKDYFWGYMPLSFFSLRGDFAATGEMHALKNEFKAMVKALHEADIEVVLDVVYNHTVEAGASGPTYSYRGIDNSSYYLLTPDMGQYRNDAGTGNVLRCAHPYVRKLIMESLRYWVREMHVDGFRFDLASIFARNFDGSLNLEDPPIISEISSDPELSGIRLIGEVWDLSAMLLGKKFPGVSWMQWNGRFRDDLRSFVKGDPGKVGAVMTRLYGSTDLFPDGVKDAYRPYQSVNYINSHDGFCLYDLVSFNTKHNEANGYDNQDGANDNLSWNCGWEGNMNVPEDVIRLRKRQVRNFCTLLMLSNGIPMFSAGDEFMNTQQGNNNPVNQDNEISWLDWDLLEKNKEIHRFFRMMIAFRKAHPSICRSHFWGKDVRWYGTSKREVDWSNASRSFAFCLNGSSMNTPDLYVMINAHWEDSGFVFHEGDSGEWYRVIDTGQPYPEDFMEPGSEPALTGNTYLLTARSVAVFSRKPGNGEA